MKKTFLLWLPLAVFLSAALWPVYTKLKAASLNQALCLAASQEDTAAVERLLKRGASPNAVGAVAYENCNRGTKDCQCTTDPLSALSLAVYYPATEFSDPMDPAAVASYDEALGTVAVLLQAGADVNKEDDGILWRARSPRMVKLLLANGAKVNLRGKDGVTVLMTVATSFHMGEMKVLMAGGADINARDSHGKSVLMYACDDLADDFGMDAVKTLIAAGANINARDDQGKTALRYALAGGQADSIQFLKKSGARL